MTILMSDKLDFRAEKIIQGKKGYYILMKGLIHQEEVTVLNGYEPYKIFF